MKKFFYCPTCETYPDRIAYHDETIRRWNGLCYELEDCHELLDAQCASCETTLMSGMADAREAYPTTAPSSAFALA